MQNFNFSRKVATIIAAFIFFSVSASAQDEGCLKVGANLGVPFYWTVGENTFIDKMKYADVWNVQRMAPWPVGFANTINVPMDPVTKYPVGPLPYNFGGNDYSLQTVVTSDAGRIPAGSYVLLYEGHATFYGGGCVSMAAPGSQNATDGRVDVTILGACNGTITIATAGSGANALRNMRLLPASEEFTYDENLPFTQDLIDKVSNLNVIRFMPMTLSNVALGGSQGWTNQRYQTGTVREWQHRSIPSQFTQAMRTGVAFEHQIQLCNQAKVNPWVNVPSFADDNFIRQMAAFFRDNLDPDLDIYLEYSNELWNGASGFDQGRFIRNCWSPGNPCGLNPTWYVGNQVPDSFPNTHWANIQALGFDGNAALESAYMQKRTFDIWYDEFGKDSVRVIRTLGTQTLNIGITQTMLTYLTEDDWDALALTWYFDVGADITSGTSINAFVTAARGAFDWQRDDLLEQSNMAKAYDKYIVGYEGGAGFELADGSAATISNAETIFASNEMEDLYIEVIDSLKEWDWREINVFLLAWDFSKNPSLGFGVWSHLKDISDPASTSGLYRGLVNSQIPGCDDVIQLPSDDFIGSGNAIRLDGYDDRVEADGVFMPDDKVDSYTMECWFKPNLLSCPQSIMAYSSDGGSDVSVSQLITTLDNRFQWRVTNDAATEVVSIIGNIVMEEDNWYHLSAVKSQGVYNLYVNGESEGVVNTNVPGTYTQRNKFTIGGKATDLGYEELLRGEVDEVRIWDTGITDVRTVRDWMCREVNVAPAHPNFGNLDTYFRFNDVDVGGEVVANEYGVNDGSTVNVTYSLKSNYFRSGAPIGNNSQNLYTTSWASAGLTYSHADGDRFSVSGMGNGNPDGVHIYVVDGAPNITTAPDYYNGLGTSKYYGVFMANGSDPSYDVIYNYNDHPDADPANESDNRLVKRDDNQDGSWEHSGADRDEIANTLSIECRERYRSEYILGFRQSNQVQRPGSGMALRFGGGTDKLNIPFTLGNGDDFTFMGWFNGVGSIFEYHSSGARDILFMFMDRNGTDPNDNYYAIIRHDRGWPRYNPDPPPFQENGNVGAVQPVYNEWNHVAFTRENGDVRLYINGVMHYENTTDFGGEIDLKDQFTVGWTSTFNGFNGAMDEISQWSRAFSEDEIRQWMVRKITKDHPYQCADLQLYYNFDEGSGTVLEDTRGPNDATLEGLTFETSGAPIGDYSVYDYTVTGVPSGFPGQAISLTLTHPDDGDEFTASATAGQNLLGMQIAMVDYDAPEVQNYPGGIQSADTTRYWIVHPVWRSTWGESDNKSYTVSYDYSNNPNINIEGEVRLLYKEDNAADPWENTGATPNTGANTIGTSGVNPRNHKEYLLGGTSTATFDININPPVTPGPFTGPTTVCSGETFTVSVPNDPDAYVYEWDIPPAFNGFSDTESIQLVAATTPQLATITVRALNQFGMASGDATFDITIQATPAEPFAIVGDIDICGGSEDKLYTIQAVAGATGYTWDVVGEAFSQVSPTQIEIDYGAGPNSVDISVTAENGSCTSAAQAITVTVNANTAPDPGAITGPSAVCGGNTETYSVVDNGDTYTWQVPFGAEILSGQGSNSIDVDLGTATGGEITVTASNGSCSSGSSSNISLTISCSATAEFSGDALTPCPAGTVNFTDGSSSATTWNWDFGTDASPATATGVGPHAVTYSSTGQKTVTLVINQGLGNEDTETKTDYVDVADAISIDNIAPSDPSNCGVNDGSITITASGGATKEYSIDNGSNWQAGTAFSTLAGGSYDVSVRNNDGSCRVDNGSATTLNAPSQPTIDNIAPSSPTDCGVNDGSITITASGGSGSLEYSIDGGSNWQAGNAFNTLGGGSFDVSVRNDNGTCQVDNASSTDLTTHVLPTLDNVVPNDPSDCGVNDGSITITASGGSGSLEYSIDGGSNWQAGNAFNSLSGASYDVSIRNDDGTCQVDDGGSTVLTAPALPSLDNVVPSDPSDCGVNDGSIAITASGGSGSLEYSIDGGSNWQAGNAFNSLSGASYDVSIRNDDGTCQVDDGSSTALTAPSPPTIDNVVPNDPSDCGVNDGSISVSASGGSGSYEFSIDGGSNWQSGSTFTSLSAASYDVSIRNNDATCQVDNGSSTTLTAPSPPSIDNIVPADPSDCGVNDGVITVTASGGSGSLEYSVDNGSNWQASNSFTSLSGASYDVSIRNDDGTCQVDNGSSTVLTSPTPPSIDNVIPANPSNCGVNDGTITVTASGGSGSLEYSIDGGANWQSSNSFTSLGVGNYDVSIRNDDGTCQVDDVGSTNLSTPASASLDNIAPGNPTDCGVNDGVITITASGGIPPLAYSIDGGANWQVSNSFTGLSGTSYDVSIRNDDGSCQVDNASSTTLTSPTPPSIDNIVPSNPTDCGVSDGSIAVTASGLSGTVEYSDDGGSSWQSGNAFTGLAAQSYDISIRYDNGSCQVDNGSSTVLTGPVPPSIDNVAFNNPSDCNVDDGNITITASGGSGSLEYSINGGGVFTPASNYSGLPSGDYDVSIRNDDGTCQVDNGSTTSLIAPTPPIIDNVASSHPTDCGANDGNITLTVSSGIGVYDYSIDGGNNWQATGVFDSLVDGSYNVSVRNNDGSCKVDEASTTDLSDPLSPVINAVTTTYTECAAGNGVIIVNASSGASAAEYSIDNGGTWQSASNFNDLDVGNYDVSVRNDDGTCVVLHTSQIDLQAPEWPAYAATDPVTSTAIAECDGLGSISISASSSSNTIEYSIDGGSNWSTTDNFTDLDEGSYSISIRNDDGSCELAYSGGDVTLADPANPLAPSMLSGTLSVCEGTEGHSYSIVEVEGDIDSYEWSGPAGWSVDVGQGDTSVVFDVSLGGASGDIEVYAERANCRSAVVTLAVSVTSIPFIDLSLSETMSYDCVDKRSAYSLDVGNSGMSYSWSIHDDDGVEVMPEELLEIEVNEDSLGVELYYDKSPRGSSWLVVRPLVTCGETLRDSIALERVAPCEDIYPGNYIAPLSGSGIESNKAWKIEGLEEFPDAEVVIFTRWGDLVKKIQVSEVADGNYWDGKYKGKVIPATYFYVIDLHEPGKELQNGTVTVVN